MSSRNETDSSSEEEEEEEEEEDVLPTHPRWVRGSANFADFSFHPSKYDLATVNMDGYLEVYRLDPGQESCRVLTKRLSKKPCRCVKYSKNGDDVVVANKSGSVKLVDIQTEKYKQELISLADSECPSNCLLVINQNLIASGDDEGTLKIWDIRKGKQPIMEEDRCHDYISDIAVDSNGKFLFVTSGDGTMITYNVKRRKFIVQSETADHDMGCVEVMKNNKKVVVGTCEGHLLLYNWEEFAASSDRFPGHPASVDCLVRINENILCTGSMDGMIRAVHILPNRFLGVIGEHHMPVHKMAVSHDAMFLASSSHFPIIKFWTVDDLHRTNVKGNAKPKKNLKTKKLVKSGISGDKLSFISDLDQDINIPTVNTSNSESDESTSEDEDVNDNVTAKITGDVRLNQQEAENRQDL